MKEEGVLTVLPLEGLTDGDDIFIIRLMSISLIWKRGILTWNERVK